MLGSWHFSAPLGGACCASCCRATKPPPAHAGQPKLLSVACIATNNALPLPLCRSPSLGQKDQFEARLFVSLDLTAAQRRRAAEADDGGTVEAVKAAHITAGALRSQANKLSPPGNVSWHCKIHLSLDVLR